MTIATDAAPSIPKLETEREFLLRSLADLESEHKAGELSDDRYLRIRDEYITRAAVVLQAIERLRAGDAVSVEGAPTGPTPNHARHRRLAIAALSIVPVLGVGGVALTRSIGVRSSGQTITGNAQAQALDLAGLARAAKASPDDEDAQLAYAQALLQANQPVDALKVFDAAARLVPGDPVPKAYGGWIVFLAGLSDEALRRLDAAVAVDATYPDARFFRGMVLLQARGDRDGALAEWREYLRLVPEGADRDRVQALVDETVKAAATTTTATP